MNPVIRAQLKRVMTLFRSMLSFSVRDLMHRPVLLVLCVTSIAICAVNLTLSSDIAYGTYQHHKAAATRAAPKVVATVRNVMDPALRITPALLDRLVSLPTCAVAYPRIEMNVEATLVETSGFEWSALEGSVADDPAHQSRHRSWGRAFLEGDREAVIMCTDLYRLMGGVIEPDGSPELDRISIRVTRVSRGIEEARLLNLRVVGLLTADYEMEGMRLYAPYSLAEELEEWAAGTALVDGAEHKVRANVFATDFESVDELAAELQSMGFLTLDRADSEQDLRRIKDALVSLVAMFLAGCLAVTSVMTVAINTQRQMAKIDELGLLAMLGISRPRVVLGLAGTQGLVIGGSAFLVAIVGHIGLQSFVANNVADAIGIEASVLSESWFSVWYLPIAGFGLCVGLSVTGSILPAFFATHRLTPARAMRFGG